MYPAPFRYHRPMTLQDALLLLVRYAPNSAILAGGQSLIPLMNLRKVRPGTLIDIGRIPGLSRMSFSDGVFSVGAMVRHQSLCEGEVERLGLPICFLRVLKQIGSQIGNLAIRHRGTFGGSLALANPASQWTLLSVLLDANVVIASTRGTRRQRYADVLGPPAQTWLGPDEVVLGADMRLSNLNEVFGFAQVAPSAGRPAMAFSLVATQRDDDRILNCRIAIGACTPRPLRLYSLENELANSRRAWREDIALADIIRSEVGHLQMIEGTDCRYAREIAVAAITRALKQAMMQ
ncbi:MULTISPECIES: FAD binding domain-containing protein [Rhizobium]|uniref:Carbon-monoxide dehydrogenase medium subunit n=1 Tax=Rhizobium lusitanum TaxID=293958 RepID=A0A1C3XHK2_9HYPH|nr:FAD binding domain-containing protein [Rhizobium lusitanum]SCB51752.1 carbon-monoxide dehydrogenase medium subunit [Rhizobium lusitanum]